MTLDALLDLWTKAGAREEGYYDFHYQVNVHSLAYTLANLGNLRNWDASHPKTMGYLDFMAWAKAKLNRDATEDAIRLAATAESVRVFKALLIQYIYGRYTPGIPRPSLRQIYRVYAPASDNNHPDSYATNVAQWIGEMGGPKIDIDTPMTAYFLA